LHPASLSKQTQSGLQRSAKSSHPSGPNQSSEISPGQKNIIAKVAELTYLLETAEVEAKARKDEKDKRLVAQAKEKAAKDAALAAEKDLLNTQVGAARKVAAEREKSQTEARRLRSSLPEKGSRVEYLQRLDEIIRLDLGGNAADYHLRARFLEEQGDLFASLTDLDTAHRIQPKDVTISRARLRLAFKTRQKEVCFAAANDVLNADRDRVTGLYHSSNASGSSRGKALKNGLVEVYRTYDETVRQCQRY